MDSAIQVLDSSLCQWNLDSGFQSLEGIRNRQAVFRIPIPWIPDSISNIFPDAGLHKQKSPQSWNPDSLMVGRLTEFQVLWFNYERTEKSVLI